MCSSVTKKVMAYAGVVSALGIPLGVYCLWRLIQNALLAPDISFYFVKFFVLLVMYVLCRSLFLYIREDYAIDMSFIINCAVILSMGAYAGGAMVLLSTPFIFTTEKEAGQKGGFRLLMLHEEPIKTLFNTSILVLSIVVGGRLYEVSGGASGVWILPDTLWASIVFIISSVVVNLILITGLFALMAHQSFFRMLLAQIKEYFPSMLACAPIGIFMGVLMMSGSGVYLAPLFLMPLLLARYSFKLYLNSKRNYYVMIRTLTAAIEAKDQYTEGHSRRVELYAGKIAAQLKFSAEQIDQVRMAAMLHDIGKIGVGDMILTKTGALTQEEFVKIREHPVIGLHILREVNFPSEVKEAILHHHERYDGKGYPDGTKGDEVSMFAYVLGVADAFDAMTSDRPYRAGMPLEQALEEIRKGSGKQFHPTVAQAFLDLMAREGEAVMNSVRQDAQKELVALE